MTIYSGIFNSINGDRKYNAWWFAKYFATFIGNGVFPNPSTGLQVMADERMQVKVRPGSGWIDGYFLYSDDDYVLELDKSDGLLKRIDRVVMRLDHAERLIKIVIKKGAFASAPVAPTLQRDGNAHELALADIFITNGATQITQANVTDTRLNKTLCGIVHGTVNQVDTTTLFNQYQSWIEQQKSLYESDLATWTAEQKQDFEDWQALNENQFVTWKNDFETAATNWFAQEQTDFETWFATLQDLLDENVATALTAKVQALETGKANQEDLVEISDSLADLEQIVTTHLDEDITSSEGLHEQIRYHNDKLEIKVENEWIELKGGSQIPVQPVSNFNAKAGNQQVTLTWSDPSDAIVDNITLAKWAHTKVIRKVGSPPQNANDGVLVVQNSVRNQYETLGFVDSGLTNDTTYYYAAFACTEDGVESDKVVINATPQAYKIYGVAIDLTNSNPQTSVTYTDDAVGMASGVAWDSLYPFSEIKPVLLNAAGVETAQLNKSNFAVDTNGNSVNIVSGDNVMIKFPKVWYKIETIGNIVHVKIATAQVDETYKCYGHTDGTTEHDAFYVGAYLGFNQSNVLKSWSGKTPTTNISLANSRTYARANGSRYNLLGFYQLTVLQILQLIRSKNLNSQEAYGQGYTGASATTTTGNTNAKGMYSGSASAKEQVKIMGLEDFYGNLRYWIDGIKSDANRNLLTTKNPAQFSDTATGYETRTTGLSANVGGYMSKPQGTTEMGFTAKETSGSTTTYFSDYAALDASYFAYFGGYWSNAAYAGAFSLYVASGGSASSHIGARLLYL